MTKKSELINKLRNYNKNIQELNDIDSLRQLLLEIKSYIIENKKLNEIYEYLVNSYKGYLKKINYNISFVVINGIIIPKSRDEYTGEEIIKYYFYFFERITNPNNEEPEIIIPCEYGFLGLLFDDNYSPFIKKLVSSIIDDLINTINYKKEKTTDKYQKVKEYDSGVAFIKAAKKYLNEHKEKYPDTYTVLVNEGYLKQEDIKVKLKNKDGTNKRKALKGVVDRIIEKAGWDLKDFKAEDFYSKLSEENFCDLG